MKNFDVDKILEQALSDFYSEVNLYELFKAKAEEYGLSVTQARQLLKIERKSLQTIFEGTSKQPNLITVMKIARFLEIDMNTAIGSIMTSQSSENIAKIEDARKVTFLAKNFDLDRLYKAGFITSKTNTDEIIKRILAFFNFKSIGEYEEYQQNLSAAVFSKTKRNFADKMRRLSIMSSFRMFDMIDNPNEYNREELKNLVPKIKPYSRDVENGLLSVCRALFNVGVTVIFQQYLPTSQYYGATMNYNNKPCIVLTDLNKNYPTIWFALLHELFHVLFDFEEIKGVGYHLTGDIDAELGLFDEEKANEFARDFFFDYQEYRFIKPHIHSNYFVSKYARTHGIHQSIIYSHFQYFIEQKEGKNYWGAFKEFFPDVSRATKNLNPLTWDKNLIEVINVLKKTFQLESNE